MVEEVDGTQNEWGWCKQKVGANAILAVSLAHHRGAAVYKYNGVAAAWPLRYCVEVVQGSGGQHFARTRCELLFCHPDLEKARGFV